MKEITLAAILKPDVIKCVNAYLLARAYAEVTRSKVNEIQYQVLAEQTLMATLNQKQPYRLTDPKQLYLCEDDAACTEFYLECNRRERAAKLKPPEMPDEHCPALVAESLQVEAENALIDCSGEPFGITSDMLYLDNRAKWIDLVCRLVINSPGYTSPTMKPKHKLQTNESKHQ